MSLKEQTREKLKMAMQREIAMMREILANMQKEELSLARQDKQLWNQILQERSQMMESLVLFRKERMVAAEELKNDTEILEDLSWMRDQMTALIEKLNVQNSRNQNLYSQSFEGRPQGNVTLCPQMAPEPQKKKGGIVATYPKRD